MGSERVVKGRGGRRGKTIARKEQGERRDVKEGETRKKGEEKEEAEREKQGREENKKMVGREERKRRGRTSKGEHSRIHAAASFASSSPASIHIHTDRQFRFVSCKRFTSIRGRTQTATRTDEQTEKEGRQTHIHTYTL